MYFMQLETTTLHFQCTNGKTFSIYLLMATIHFGCFCKIAVTETQRHIECINGTKQMTKMLAFCEYIDGKKFKLLHQHIFDDGWTGRRVTGEGGGGEFGGRQWFRGGDDDFALWICENWLFTLHLSVNGIWIDFFLQNFSTLQLFICAMIPWIGHNRGCLTKTHRQLFYFMLQVK